MQTFLERAAAHVFNTYSDQLNRITVVLPTNRACFFFKRSLAMQTEKPVWSPQVLAIDDFITQAADADLVEPISLLWLLYDVCKEIDPQVEFDKFTAWAHTLLLDFDKIDQYLVDTDQLFDFLSKAKAIERWQPDMLPQQGPVNNSILVDKYFKLWENLEKTYSTLKTRLTEQKKAYRGMMYRWVAENPQVLLKNTAVEKYVFVGLNALSNAEEKMLKALVKANKAEILWDSDTYYMEANPEVKAGDLLRKYKSQGKLGPWNWQTDDLLAKPKDIYIVGVPNASIQGKVAGQIYLQQLREYKATEEQVGASAMTAIVMPDENLLMPVIQSLDKEVEDFNITMGLSLKNSNLFTLVNTLFELQYLTITDTREQKKKIPKFNHRHVIKVLSHPFIKQYEQLFLQGEEPETENQPGAIPKNFIQHTLREISRQQKVFLSPKDLQEFSNGHELFRVLFTPWQGDSQKALYCFHRLIDLLRQVYKTKNDAIETEYLFLFYTIIKRLDAILKERKAHKHAEPLSLRSFKLFLYELFKQTKIPFSGEPVSSLQIMGMLETRTLDFDTVIILSANEKVLPQAKKQNSLIPVDASLNFGIPTYRSQEATMSYHFYRLLQRAKKVYLLHLLPSDTYGAGEKSRFVYQIEYELIKYNPLIRLHHQTVRVKEPEVAAVPVSLEVKKTDALLYQMREEMAKGLYPSQLNTYFQCTLRYYFSYLAKLQVEEEVEETIGAGTFGDLVHKTLESIDKELAERKRPLLAADLTGMIPSVGERVKSEFIKHYPGYSLETGLNYLLYKIAVQVIGNFLEHQIKQEKFPLEILGLEKVLSAFLTVKIAGKPVSVKISGRIDRIDKIGNTIRVIDYKTGKVESKHLKVSELDLEDTLLHDPEGDKIRQLWLYKYILGKRMLHEKGLRLADRYLKAEEHQLIAGIYSFRNIASGLLTDQFSVVGDKEESLETFVEKSEGYLQRIIASILDPDQPFERTSRLEACIYCFYKNICGR